jgi:DNA invertase Pin-like site-specific DNA recombinase
LKSSVREQRHGAEKAQDSALWRLRPQIIRGGSRARVQLAAAQPEVCEAFIYRQAGGVSADIMERPALQGFMADLEQGLVDAVVVYKVDRLTRTLADFAKMCFLRDVSRHRRETCFRDAWR